MLPCDPETLHTHTHTHTQQGWPNAAPDTFFATRLDQPSTAVRTSALAPETRRGKLAIIVIVSGLTQENLHARLRIFR